MPILLTNATLATMVGGYGLIEGAAIVMEGETIAFAGTLEQLPESHKSLVPQDLASASDLDDQELQARRETSAALEGGRGEERVNRSVAPVPVEFML